MNEDKIRDFLEETFGSDCKISIREYRDDGYNIELERMYSYIKVNFSSLLKCGEFFKTKDIDVDEWYESGCSTCDHGSSYTKSLQVRNVGSAT
jgi:hypothetical protein